MAHLSEGARQLNILNRKNILSHDIDNMARVEFLYLPYIMPNDGYDIEEISNKINGFIRQTNERSTIVILTSHWFANILGTSIKEVSLKLWIAVKTEFNDDVQNGSLNNNHSALLVFTRYKEGLNHTKTRIEYSYCPICDKTTKDYGGKKHLYNSYGTLMSDIWRDITLSYYSEPKEIINRLSDLFGVEEYKDLYYYNLLNEFIPGAKTAPAPIEDKINFYRDSSVLLHGDCIEELKKIPDNSIDFCFADPPYNIKKKYENWNDGVDIQEYFDWCDQWLSELARILKPNRTLAVLNIPQWCIRHFHHLNTILNYQDWIVWEGLSMPVRMVMPAHYSILCFSKGESRKLPGIERTNNNEKEKDALYTMKENFCNRPACKKHRLKANIKDHEIIGNIWWDIHRLKHNSRRVDHPCQLPPMFMNRLISLFTNEGEFVLDPFNGAGTTTLSAEILNRKYIGIELSEYYHNITTKRHEEVGQGIDPFRKQDDNEPKVKNSPVGRIKKQKYQVSKKVLQLEVKKIAATLGKIPNREEVSKLSQYPIEFYDSYFINWGEVCAAARTTGMTESKTEDINDIQLKTSFN